MDLNKTPMKIYGVSGGKTIQNKNISEESGVYFIWLDYELLYIGSTGNLRKRIAQHISFGFTNQHLINSNEAKKVSVMITKDRFEAFRIEELLIELIPTKWNEKSFYNCKGYQDWRKRNTIGFNDKQKEVAKQGENNE